jgi:hypothetical protein
MEPGPRSPPSIDATAAGHRREKLFQPGSSHWSIRYGDGKADPALVERWINIPYSRGMIHFFHSGLVKGLDVHVSR